MPHVYDIAVLGANAGGYAATCFLASHKLDVVVLGSPAQSVECPLADWAPADFFRMAGLPKGLLKATGGEEFSTVIYHNAALDRQSEHSTRSTAGAFLPAGKLVKALAAAAGKAGVKTRTSSEKVAIRLAEDLVTLAGSSSIVSRIAILAQSRPEDIFSELSLPARSVPQSPISAAGLDIPMTDKAAVKTLGGAMHIVQSPQRGEMGMYFAVGGMVHVRVIRGASSPQQHASELSSLVSRLQQAGLLPGDLQLNKARGALWQPPAGVALELETHVAKRCLLAGTAGGFADSITGATIKPTVHSALLAAEVARAACKADDPQNVLSDFKFSWRQPMAEFLRPPNTSLSMLMPLLFVNSRIAAKFTTALLHGKSI